MGMSTHVVGIVPPDETWKKMKDVWDACRQANIAVPPEVQKFFNYDEPDDKGGFVSIPVNDWDDGSCCQGYEIEVDKIPPNVKIIRFYNSW